MNDQVKYSLAGFCMGVAELIPGISGATIAVIFRIYPNLMKILSNIRVKNITLNLSSLSQTFQFNVSLPLILSMIIAIIFCSKGVNFLLINFEDLFLLSLGLLMIALSFYIVQYFKDALIDKKTIFILIFWDRHWISFARIEYRLRKYFYAVFIFEWNIGFFIFFNTWNLW